MNKILIAAASVLALSGLVQARAESNGLAEVERPAATGTILSAPSLRDTGSEGYQELAGPSVPVMSGQVLPTNGSEGIVQTANSLPPGFMIGTPEYAYAQSDIHDVTGDGSEFRSRGANTTIINSRIVSGSHADNYTVDLPAGGKVLLQNDVFEKAAGATNPYMIHYSPDQQVPWHGPSALKIIGSTFINDAGPSAVGIDNLNGPAYQNGGTAPVTAELTNNRVYGLSASHLIYGQVNQSGTTYLTSRPTIDTYHPWG